MIIKSGNNSRRMGDLHCEKCRHKTFAQIGEIIPACPKCGHDSFNTGSPVQIKEDPVQRVQRLLAALAQRKSLASVCH